MGTGRGDPLGHPETSPRPCLHGRLPCSLRFQRVPVWPTDNVRSEHQACARRAPLHHAQVAGFTGWSGCRPAPSDAGLRPARRSQRPWETCRRPPESSSRSAPPAQAALDLHVDERPTPLRSHPSRASSACVAAIGCTTTPTRRAVFAGPGKLDRRTALAGASTADQRSVGGAQGQRPPKRQAAQCLIDGRSAGSGPGA